MLTVQLIGAPRLTREGVPAPAPRGAKSWAVLGRVLRSRDPVSRQQLVDELYPEANDPLAALRWTLAEVRRSLELPDAMRGNPVALADRGLLSVDVDTLSHGVLPDPCPRGTFLDGVTVRASPAFEMWLLIERQHVAAELLAALRRECLGALSAGRPAAALALAQLMVETAPLDEGAHVLLVRSLAAAGDSVGAAKHVAYADGFFRRELGAAPGPQLASAARAITEAEPRGATSAAEARELLATGRARLASGAAAVGVAALRRAVEAADGCRDVALDARCKFELGAALVHAVRGYDDEGAVLLHAAHEAAVTAGDRETAANALAELAYVEVLAARRESAAAHLAEAWRAAEGLPKVRAEVAAFEAVHLSDWGRLEQSLARFEEAIEMCEEAGSVRRGIWALACAARTAYLAEWHHAAVRWSQEAIDASLREAWPAIRPWAAVWLARSRLAMGVEPARIRSDLLPAHALAVGQDDPCWIASASNAMGLTYERQGDLSAAGHWLDRALVGAASKADTYRWVVADVTISAAEIALRRGDTMRAHEWARIAVEGAARGDMPALLARAARVFQDSRPES